MPYSTTLFFWRTRLDRKSATIKMITKHAAIQVTWPTGSRVFPPICEVQG